MATTGPRIFFGSITKFVMGLIFGTCAVLLIQLLRDGGFVFLAINRHSPIWIFYPPLVALPFFSLMILAWIDKNFPKTFLYFGITISLNIAAFAAAHTGFEKEELKYLETDKIALFHARYAACPNDSIEWSPDKRLGVCGQVDESTEGASNAILYDSTDEIMLPRASRSEGWTESARRLFPDLMDNDENAVKILPLREHFYFVEAMSSNAGIQVMDPAPEPTEVAPPKP